MTADTADCLFCRIVRREIPADVVVDNEHCLAFRDVDPKAPTHVLVIPKEHHPNLAALASASSRLTAELVATCAEVAAAEGLAEPGYRVVFNTGGHGGQEVRHLHGHVLGGRQMTWPPG